MCGRRWRRDRARIDVAALYPFGGYESVIDDQLAGATAVLDAHIVKHGTQVVDKIRRRVQQDTTGHRGRDRGRRTTRGSAPRLAALSAAARRLPGHQPDRRQASGREYPRPVPHLPHPRSRAPRTNPAALARGVPGLLHHRRRKQRQHRGPSTASSSCTDASPAATATATTTGHACCSCPERELTTGAASRRASSNAVANCVAFTTRESDDFAESRRLSRSRQAGLCWSESARGSEPSFGVVDVPRPVGASACPPRTPRSSPGALGTVSWVPTGSLTRSDRP